jgi:hypothetical protein
MNNSDSYYCPLACSSICVYTNLRNTFSPKIDAESAFLRRLHCRSGSQCSLQVRRFSSDGESRPGRSRRNEDKEESKTGSAQRKIMFVSGMEIDTVMIICSRTKGSSADLWMISRCGTNYTSECSVSGKVFVLQVAHTLRLVFTVSLEQLSCDGITVIIYASVNVSSGHRILSELG